MVKDFSATKNTLQITKLLKVLGQDFALSQNPNTRKGGLIGLAAIAVALGKESSLYIGDLIHPILACFADSDPLVRYYACESLYNVSKVARGSVLVHFTDIFSVLSKLAADPDQKVRSGSEHLDKLMKVTVALRIENHLSTLGWDSNPGLLITVKLSKTRLTHLFSCLANVCGQKWRADAKGWACATTPAGIGLGTHALDHLSTTDIVTESASFDLVGLMPHLRKKIYSNNTFARQFIISWVSVLDAVPDIDLIIFLPEILDGLFRILEDPNKEIQKMCDTVLNEFLRSIKKDPSRVKFDEMINILITHSQSPDELLQFTAITWIKEFVQLSGRKMLPFASGILTAVLPCLSYDTDSRRNIKETAKAVNFTFMKLVTEGDDKETFPVEVVGDVMEEEQLDLPSLVDVLTKHLHHTSVATKVSVLRWIYHLYIKIPTKVQTSICTRGGNKCVMI
ncbi:unnamed protein product [Timema podura]|uniref:Protein VAC14 homolog n=1 Tax=Timema podura TaxID=61482 RepID=A0ABN7NNY2_TIMPD|nr:unnamed protein product [Timema podura]